MPRPEEPGRSVARREALLSGLAFTALFLFATSGTLHAPLSVHEEHRILEDALGGPRLWAQVAHDDLWVLGRVRPMFLGWHFLKIALVGARPMPQHLLTAGLGVLAAILLSRALRNAGGGLTASLLVPPLVLLSGPHGDIWFMLFSSAETIGMPLLALALWALVRASRAPQPRRWDALWLGAAVLAALAKESFLLVLPALAGLRIALEWNEGQAGLRWLLRARRGLLVAAAVACVLLAGASAASVVLLPRAYAATAAGLGGRSLLPATWWAVVRSEDVWPVTLHALAAVALIGALVALAPLRARAAARAGLALGLYLAWMLPQVVLYAGGMSHRYVLPALVAPAALYGLALTWAWRTPRPWARVLCVVGWAWASVTIAMGTGRTFQRSWSWGAEARATHLALATLASRVPDDHSIVVAADPATGWGFEATLSLQPYLAQAGWHGATYLLPVEAPAYERSPPNAALAEQMLQMYSVHERGDVARIGGVLIMNEVGSAPTLLWLAEQAGWRDVGSTQPKYRIDLRLPFVVRGDDFRRRALVRAHPAAAFPLERPLVRVKPALAERVGVNPMLRTPYGLETVAGQTIAWLGPGVDGGAQGVLWAEGPLVARAKLTVAHGPGRQDSRRTVRFIAGDVVQTATFDVGAVLAFDLPLQAGANRFRVEVADEATTPVHPGGDPRQLMVMLQHVEIEAR